MNRTRKNIKTANQKMKGNKHTRHEHTTTGNKQKEQNGTETINRTTRKEQKIDRKKRQKENNIWGSCCLSFPQGAARAPVCHRRFTDTHVCTLFASVICCCRAGPGTHTGVFLLFDSYCVLGEPPSPLSDR